MLEKIRNRTESKNLNGLFEIRKDIRIAKHNMCNEFFIKFIKLIKK